MTAITESIFWTDSIYNFPSLLRSK